LSIALGNGTWMRCSSKPRERCIIYAVRDDKSQVIALYVSERRDMYSTLLCLRKQNTY